MPDRRRGLSANASKMLYTPGRLVSVKKGGRVKGREVGCKADDDPISLQPLVEGRGYADKVGKDAEKRCYVPDYLEEWAATRPTDPHTREPMTAGDLAMLNPGIVNCLYQRARLDCGDVDSRDECARLGTKILGILHHTIDKEFDRGFGEDYATQLWCTVGPKHYGDTNAYELRLEKSRTGEECTYTERSPERRLHVTRAPRGNREAPFGDPDAFEAPVKHGEFEAFEESTKPLFDRVALDWRGWNKPREYNLLIGTIAARLIECAMGHGMGNGIIVEGGPFAGGDEEASRRLGAAVFEDARNNPHLLNYQWAQPGEYDFVPTHFETLQRGVVLYFEQPIAAEVAFDHFNPERGYRLRRIDSAPLSKSRINRMLFNNFISRVVMNPLPHEREEHAPGTDFSLGIWPLFHGPSATSNYTESDAPARDRVWSKTKLFDDRYPSRWNDGLFSTMRHVAGDNTKIRFNAGLPLRWYGHVHE